jgi:hypothetical protein
VVPAAANPVRGRAGGVAWGGIRATGGTDEAVGQWYPKGRLPRRVFDRSGPPILTLVTCGGAFDRATRHYSDNVVIYAVPSAPAAGSAPARSMEADR